MQSRESVMKKIVLMCLFGFAISINIDDLSDEKKQIYNREKITIEPYRIGDTFSGYRWNVYAGFELISEEDFFRMTGYSDEAEQSKKYQKTRRRVFLAGLGMFIIFIGMNKYADSLPESAMVGESWTSNPERYKWGDASIWPFAGGLVTTTLSLAMGKNKYTYSMAKDIADSYNKKLIQLINE